MSKKTKSSKTKTVNSKILCSERISETSVAEMLVEKSSNNRTLEEHYDSQEHEKEVTATLKLDARISVRECDWWFEAVRKNDLEELEGLCENGEYGMHSLDENGLTPLCVAIINKHWKAAKMLLDYGAEPNMGAVTPLVLTAIHGNADMAKSLIGHGAEIELKSYGWFDKKMTPLHIAANQGHFDVVKLLVEAGANLEKRSDGRERKTALEWALNGRNLMKESEYWDFGECYNSQIMISLMAPELEDFTEVINYLIEKSIVEKIEHAYDENPDENAPFMSRIIEKEWVLESHYKHSHDENADKPGDSHDDEKKETISGRELSEIENNPEEISDFGSSQNSDAINKQLIDSAA